MAISNVTDEEGKERKGEKKTNCCFEGMLIGVVSEMDRGFKEIKMIDMDG